MSESAARRLVDTRVVVETPEGVDFRFRIAGPGQRLWAWSIDSLIKAGALAILWIVLLMLGAIGGEAGLQAMARQHLGDGILENHMQLAIEKKLLQAANGIEHLGTAQTTDDADIAKLIHGTP